MSQAAEYRAALEAAGREREEFLRGQVADLVAALAETKAQLKAWMLAEAIVYEITPAGREALAKHKEGA